MHMLTGQWRAMQSWLSKFSNVMKRITLGSIDRLHSNRFLRQALTFRNV